MSRIVLSLLLLAAAAPAAEARAQAAGPHAAAPSQARVIVRVGGAAAKVTAPVEVQIAPLPDPGPGRRRVRITARPTVDAASFSLDVAAESGLALADPAAAAWRGQARAGEEVTREVDLAVTGPGELRLVVTAAIEHGGGVAQTGIHVFAFHPAQSPDAALTKNLRPARATDPGGRTIVEVPAQRP